MIKDLPVGEKGLGDQWLEDVDAEVPEELSAGQAHGKLEDHLQKKRIKLGVRKWTDGQEVDFKAALTDTIGEVFNKGAEVLGEKVKWRPKSADEDPFPLVMAVMRHNFIDLVRSAGHKRVKLMEPATDAEGVSVFDDLPAFDRALNKLLVKPTVGFADVEAGILAEAFYRYAEGDQDLIDVIDAVVYCECRKRSEIAEWLVISPQEVTDRWEKLRYNYTRHR